MFFASQLMDPSVFAHFGDWSDTVRNSLWISACAGLGMWIYDRFSFGDFLHLDHEYPCQVALQSSMSTKTSSSRTTASPSINSFRDMSKRGLLAAVSLWC